MISRGGTISVPLFRCRRPAPLSNPPCPAGLCPFDQKNSKKLPDAFILKNKYSIIFDEIFLKQSKGEKTMLLAFDVGNTNIVLARQIAMYLCRTMLDCSFKKIGEEFGGKDHSTVIASIAKVEKMLKENSDYLIAINEIKEIIKKH